MSCEHPLTRAYLNGMSHRQLKEICRSRHYRVTGHKSELSERVLNGDPIGLDRYHRRVQEDPDDECQLDIRKGDSEPEANNGYLGRVITPIILATIYFSSFGF